MPKKFIIKDEEGQQFEVTETDEELPEESSEETEMHDDESFTSDEIAALKELAKRSADLLKLLAVEEDEHEAVGDEDDLDIDDEDVDEKEEVIETKSTDSKKSVGSIEKTRAKDSANFNKEIEIANAWSKRFNKTK